MLSMSDLRSRVAYLQGLSEGTDLNVDTKEGKILQGIIDVLVDIVDVMDDIEESQVEMEEYIETIDEDLLNLEDDFYEGKTFDTNNNKEKQYVEVDCPECGETVCFDADILEDEDDIEVICPSCDTVVFINDDHTLVDENPHATDGNTLYNANNNDAI